MPSVSQIQWNDTNEKAGEIGGGVVSWTPPADVSSIDAYQVFIAYDSLGAYEAQLWWLDTQTEEFAHDFPVGTNSFVLFNPTHRQTTNIAYPANWLLVYSKSGGVLQETADAAKTPLYDSSTSAPSAVDLTVDTSGTYLTGSSTIAGTVQWSPAEFADLGFTENYAVYVSPAFGDTGSEVSVQDVPLGTNELVLTGSKTCSEGSYIVVYAKNPYGRASSGSWQVLEACPRTTLAVTTTTLPATTTTAALESGTFIFSDTNSEANQIGGAVLRWSPTTDTAATHYQVYIASDDLGSYMAQLWHMDPVTEDVMRVLPVGTNEFHVFDPTMRRTTDSAYPANWIFLFTSNGGVLQSEESALKVRLYDLSTSVPNYVAMSHVSVIDIDNSDSRVAGSVQWTVDPQSDLGFTTHFTIYLARDATGTGEAYVGSVTLGTNRLLFFTDCWDRNHVLVYANNPNGRATQAASSTMTGCTTADPAGDPTTTTTLVTTTTTITTTTLSPTSVFLVQFTDTNTQAGQIGGSTISWQPPTHPSQVSSYEVYVAYDKSGSYKARLWYQDTVSADIGAVFPVGTNQFQIFDTTARATTHPAYPANWVIVYSVVGGARQYSEAATTLLYDASTGTPPDVVLTITFTDVDAADYTIGGTVQWTTSGQADLGFATHYALYLARDASGTGELALQSVPMGTNELVMAAGTECWDRNYLLIYMYNPNGRSSQPSSQLLDGCTSSQPSTSTATGTTTTFTETTFTETPVTVAGSSDAANSTFLPTSPTTTYTFTVTTIATSAITALTFTDGDAQANQIGASVIEWVPATDSSSLAGYQVYIANDESGSHKVPLWHADPYTEVLDNRFPVGTNKFWIFDPTTRATADAAYPANWVIVFTMSTSGGLQAVEDAVKVPLYDVSSNQPGNPSLVVDSSGTYLSNEEIAGSVQWSVSSSQEDLGFTEHLAVYLAADASGSGQVNVLNASRASDTIALPAGYRCASAGYLALYAENPNGKAVAADWQLLSACIVSTKTTTTATTTSTVTAGLGGEQTTTTLVVLPTRISGLTFTDMDPARGAIGGAIVTWIPPSDLTNVVRYDAYIAYDEEGAYEAQLWWENADTSEIGRGIPVGTNQITLFHSTTRRTKLSGYPANWLIVYTHDGTQRQAVGDAAKLLVYDDSGSRPFPVFLDWITFTDLDSADERIYGLLQWQPASLSDLGIASEYTIYLSSNTMGFGGKVKLSSVPMGTTEIWIPLWTYCWNLKYILIYASNPHGEAFFGASYYLLGCTTNEPTSTATTTTVTVTTMTITTITGVTTETATTQTASTQTVTTSTASTSTASTSTATATTTVEPWLISNLVFNDTNTEAGQIGGAILEWTPPSDTSTITSYNVYIASDELGSDQVQLWFADPTTEQMGFHFPVGTNRFNVFSPTARRTADSSHPANWVLVYTRSGSTLQSVSDAAKVPLYDASSNVPGSLSLALTFTDQGSVGGSIVGTVGWTIPATTDLGYTAQYNVYQAVDAAGTQKKSLQSVSVGTNELVIPDGTTCSDGDYIVVYAANPNGESSQAAVVSPSCPTTTTSSLV